MAKYLARSCPKCTGYFGVIVSRLPHRSSIRAVSGWCKRCNYEIAWALVVKEPKRPATARIRNQRARRDRYPFLFENEEQPRFD